MARTNIDIDEEACAAVMRRFFLKTKRDAVNFSLRRVANEITPMTKEQLLDFLESGPAIDFDVDLSTMRDDGHDPRG